LAASRALKLVIGLGATNSGTRGSAFLPHAGVIIAITSANRKIRFI